MLYTIKLSDKLAKLLVTSLILPKLYVCNSIINGIPDYLLHKLQIVVKSTVVS